MPRFGRFDIAQKSEKGPGGFLTGFEGKSLVVGGGVVADMPDHVADGLVIGVIGRFRDEADVGRDAWRANYGGEIADCQGAALSFLRVAGGMKPTVC